ncbi:nuclear protein 1b [Erpetoichthys calabaricus]|uniref:Nuclear protein 1-like n=1 Tax=Erpetoichthys calabaricus TaxID=27687 RepID=A0A8C4TM71_ERPCA|nr:nuclear protein 1b [Erpetoichthys calabaricus]
MSSYVDVKNMKPTEFEGRYFDQYDYYSLTDRYCQASSSRKGRSKKEADENTNKPSPAGHERKIANKLQQSDKKGKKV